MNNTSSIGSMNDGVYALRGIPLPDLIREGAFADVLWFTWTGVHPSEPLRRVIEACLIACVDHGAEPPSAHVARITVSCGKPLADAVAAGTLTFGTRHGNAAGNASRWIREAVAAGKTPKDVAAEAVASSKRLPGLGHPVYATDPRVTALTDVIQDAGISHTHLDFARAVAVELSTLKGKPLPLNIDGALGAIVADAGAPPDIADALFIVARAGGLAAHALEQAQQSSSGTYARG